MTDIYNPWSVINMLKTGEVKPYWVNTSGNGLVNNLIKTGTFNIKEKFRDLLEGNTIHCIIDEEIVFSQLDYEEDAIWSLFLAGGYLKAVGTDGSEYELAVTNYEVLQMFKKMVRGWFKKSSSNYNGFLMAMLNDDIEGMNGYLNRVTSAVFSYFDTGGEPEKFYHGFVLGLIVEFEGIKTN